MVTHANEEVKNDSPIVSAPNGCKTDTVEPEWSAEFSDGDREVIRSVPRVEEQEKILALLKKPLEELDAMSSAISLKPDKTWPESEYATLVYTALRVAKARFKRAGAASPEWSYTDAGFTYTHEFAKVDAAKTKDELRAFYPILQLACIKNFLITRRSIAQLTEGEQTLLSRVTYAHMDAVQISMRNNAQKEALSSYGGLKPYETPLSQWRYVSHSSGVVYLDINRPTQEFIAKMMDARVPKKYWVFALDENGKQVSTKAGPVRMKPSESHLQFLEFQVDRVTLHPNKDVTYTDEAGNRCFNKYQKFIKPPRPAEKYFVIVEAVREWVEFIYPGRADFILDWFAHMYQKPEEKTHISLVLGGPPGAGKNILLSLLLYSMRQQDKVKGISKGDLIGRFSDFLLWQILVMDEPNILRSEPHFETLRDRLKEIIGGMGLLPIECKNKPQSQVVNIHRVLICTNFPERIPRDKKDRRFAILSTSVDEGEFAQFFDAWLRKYCGVGMLGCIFENLWSEGYGHALVHYLMERDISGFDPFHLPRELLAEYDETPTQRVPENMAAALNEVTVTFELWRRKKYELDVAGFPTDVSEVMPKHWPDFVPGQLLRHTRAAYSDDYEGELIANTSGRNNYINKLFENAGYRMISPPEDATQWRASAKPNEIRAQTSLFVKDGAFPNGTPQAVKITDAKRLIKDFSEYLKTAEGIAAYYDPDLNAEPKKKSKRIAKEDDDKF